MINHISLNAILLDVENPNSLYRQIKCIRSYKNSSGVFEEDIADQLGGRTGIHQRTGRYNIPQTGTALYDDQRTGAFLGKYGTAITDGIDAAHHIAVILKTVSADAVHCLSKLCQREAGTPQLFQYLSQLRLKNDQ